jgi:Subtilase family/FG-GAP repeat
VTIGALTACLLGTAVGATTLPPAAGARPAAAPASDPPAPAPLDCAHWRYANVKPGPLPKEQDPSDYKRTSERTKTAALHDSPQQLCGQMGPATDLAWGITQGSDAVTTAILDSGIKWRDEGSMKDLATKAYLNRGELPVPAGGTASPNDQYDRNGDGVFNVDDYANDPRVTDKNDNKLLDPEDLILTFSNGRDNDHNGYVDDISGWDFLNNDNNPLDEVDYGHGTGEAKDSTAAANGTGDVGSCPNCRFLPVRVGDSFIVDGARFAAGILFALDSGASLIQEAEGGLSVPPQAQQAIDAAYKRGVPVVASMADEAAKHPNPPGALEHTMRVNSVTTNIDFLQPESYLAINGCTNYGGLTFVSVSSGGCSSEATGQSSGMVGLVESEARAAGIAPYPGQGGNSGNVLSAQEVYQIVRATADDVNFSTPTSHDPANNFHVDSFLVPTDRYPTTPGWDGTDGYGRINAYEMVKAVRDKQIPPEADISSPATLALLPTHGSVPVVGRVAAVRASSYCYHVEWAVGMQAPPYPATDQWTATGDDQCLAQPKEGVLGTLDLASIAAALPNGGTGSPVDANGKPDEERFSVRLRVVVTDDQHRIGMQQKQVFVHNDPDLVGGTPRAVAGAGGVSPVFANLDGKPGDELIVATADGFVHAYDAQGHDIPGWPVKAVPASFWHPRSATARADAIARPGSAFINGAPAVVDLDHDGKLEVAEADLEGNVYVWDAGGHRRRGFGNVLVNGQVHTRVHTNPAFSAPDSRDQFNRTGPGIVAAPVAADLDGDGRMELIASSLDRHVYAWHDNGAPVAGFPVLVVDPKKVDQVDPISNKVHFIGEDDPKTKVGISGGLVAPAAVGDINGDGKPEIIVGAQEQYDESVNVFLPIGIPGKSGNTRLFAIEHDGTAHPQAKDAFPAHPAEQAYLPGWPVPLAMELMDVLPDIGDGVATQAAIADVNGDGKADVIATSAAGPIYVLDAEGKSIYFSFVNPPVALGWLFDGDMGSLRNASDLPIFSAFGGPAVGKIAGGPNPNITAPVAGLSRALDTLLPDKQTLSQPSLMAWDGPTQHALAGFPHVTADIAFFVTPAIADLDGNAKNETIAGNGTYMLDALEADGRSSAGYPKLTGGWLLGTPGLGDWDGDGTAEMAVVRRDGQLLVWHTKAASSSLTEWPRYGHDGSNDANYATATH